MRIATVLAVAYAYGVVIDALTQDEPNHPMLRELSDNESQSQFVPALFLLADSPSASTCSWGNDLKCLLTASNNNLKLGDASCNLAPIPTDNYVADSRVNKFDDALTSSEVAGKPHIEITSKLDTATSTTTTGRKAWKAYMANPGAAQSSIIFDTPGLYRMSISATDYDHEAICTGCIAVRDEFLPQFKPGGKTCPVSPSPKHQTLTTDSLGRFMVYEGDYDACVDADNIQNNQNSAVGECGTSTHGVKLFLTDDSDDSADSADDYADTSSCFGDGSFSSNVAKLSNSPFPAKLSAATPTPNQCNWCCQKSKILEEEDVQYSCLNENNPPRPCRGRNDATSKCAMDVCLTATGKDIATATVSITETVKKASATVIKSLGLPAETDKTKTIYRSIPCTSFDPAGNDPTCHYVAKLEDLFQPETHFVDTFPTPTSTSRTNADNFVFWRYKPSSEGNWATWNPNNELSFDGSVTAVTVQAWTACGKIAEEVFIVNLYLHTSLVCNNFPAMLTGVGVTETPPNSLTFCNVPGSDFSLFNLKYDYKKIFPAVADEVAGKYKDVECKIVVKDSNAGATISAGTLVTKTGDQTIDRDFAVELVHDPTTAKTTNVQVTCTFTRTAHDHTEEDDVMLADDGPHSIDCPHTFNLIDCDGPELEPGVAQTDVCADKCAGKPDPGMNEACGGYIVTSNGATTTVTNNESPQTCCAGCSPSLQCNAVKVSSAADSTVRRCEVTGTGGLLMAELAAAEQNVFTSETTTALLGASAMVAIVAMVVVKRRADAAAHATEYEDAYYPLLE